MKIELTANEVREMLLVNLQKISPLDLSAYDIEIDSAERYGRNAGGMEITLTKKETPADIVPGSVVVRKT